MAARVPQRAVEALARTYGSRPDHLAVAAGPSIGACCYEVGAELRQAFIEAGFAAQIDRWFSKTRAQLPGNPSLPGLPSQADADHWFFDGWTCVADQLMESGVAATSIYMPRLCTASHAQLFCSYRRDGAPAGRLAGAIRPAPNASAVWPRRVRYAVGVVVGAAGAGTK
jgi:copper oxidase (laccase) domain-containing protein